ncbi:peptide chain release factor H [Sinomicrobium sp. M5D2P9]
MKTMILITAGDGPAECTKVVAQVLKKFLDEARNEGIEVTVIEKENGEENGTVASVLLFLEGKDVRHFCKSWVGTVQWTGKSQYRKHHKRKNWYIGIFEIEKTDTEEVSEKDIKYQACRSSGAGGQHVNKVSSAVRATHIPTGISVQAMDSRSQHRNKELARMRLFRKLEEEKQEQYRKQFAQLRDKGFRIERGSPVRIFTGSDFKEQKTDKSYKKQRQQLKNKLRNDIDS